MRTEVILLSMLFVTLNIPHIRGNFFSGIWKSFQQKIQSKTKVTPCDEETLVAFLADIQIINPETIIRLSTLEDLKPLCSKVSTNLERVDEFLSKCEPPNQPDLYMQLIKGVECLYRKLCTKSKFRKKFQEHFQCLHEMDEQFTECNGKPDWVEDADPETICSEYKSISDCYYVKSAKVCGLRAAKLMKELLVAIINSIITVKCDNIEEAPYLSDVMPESEICMSKVCFLNTVNICHYFYKVFCRPGDAPS